MRRRFPAATLFLALALSGCGRFGFGAEQAAISDRPDPDGDTGDGHDGAAGDGRSDGSADGDLAGDGSTGDGSGDGADGSDAGSDPVDASTPPEPDAGGGGGGGGGGTDAGSGEVDAGPTAAPYPLPAPIDCGAYTGVVSCDNFDGSRTGSPVVGSQDGYAVNIANGFATTFVGGSDARSAVQTSFAPVTGGSIYLRFSMYLPSGPEILGLNIGTFGQLDTDGDFGLDLNLEPGNVEIYTTGTGDVYNAPYVLPRDRWVCVLLKVDRVDDANGITKAVFDGNEELALSGVDTEPPTGIVGAAAGIDWTYDGQPATTLYLDNFLVTRDHPGNCP